jgi:hypothetical protein
MSIPKDLSSLSGFFTPDEVATMSFDEFKTANINSGWRSITMASAKVSSTFADFNDEHDIPSRKYKMRRNHKM